VFVGRSLFGRAFAMLYGECIVVCRLMYTGLLLCIMALNCSVFFKRE